MGGRRADAIVDGLRTVGADRGVMRAVDDQQRVATPASALAAGASHLVIGRPVTKAEDPLAALRRLAAEMEGA